MFEICVIMLIYSVVFDKLYSLQETKIQLFFKLFCQFQKCSYFCTRKSQENDLLAQLV